MEQFRDRLVEFKSLNDVSGLIGELHACELGDARPLAIFVVKSILEEVYGRLSDRALPTTTWNQVRDALRGPLEAVVDAPDSVLSERLNALTRVWVRTRQELLL